MNRLHLIVAPLVLAVAASAQADSFFLTGDFSADFTGSGLTPTTLDGSWTSDTFDDSVVTGAVQETFEVALTDLSLTPGTIGTTAFDLTNTRLYLTYALGDLTFVILGGTPNDANLFPLPAVDDLAVTYDPTTGGLFPGLGAQITNAGQDDNVGVDTAATGSFQIVPESTSLALLGLSVAAMAHRRRRA